MYVAQNSATTLDERMNWRRQLLWLHGLRGIKVAGPPEDSDDDTNSPTLSEDPGSAFESDEDSERVEGVETVVEAGEIEL